MEYETNDGWNLETIYPLGEFITSYDELSKNIYELKNCVRSKSLIKMRDDLLEKIEEMKSSLNEISDIDVLIEREE